MIEAKIKIRVGQIEFLGQGQQDWVAKQLDKVLAKAEELVDLAPPPPADEVPPPPGQDNRIATKTLPVFLEEKGAKKNQQKKFLATAIWLHAHGKTSLKTADVTAALRQSHQTRVGNASDCLNGNVRKGYCEKVGKEFFVTDEGKASH